MKYSKKRIQKIQKKSQQKNRKNRRNTKNVTQWKLSIHYVRDAKIQRN